MHKGPSSQWKQSLLSIRRVQLRRVLLPPSPLDVESSAIHDELVEGLLGGHLGSLPGGELDEGTLLSLHNSDRADLAELVEMISEETQAKENRLGAQILLRKRKWATELFSVTSRQASPMEMCACL